LVNCGYKIEGDSLKVNVVRELWINVGIRYRVTAEQLML
jgi:hypothetical protein